MNANRFLENSVYQYRQLPSHFSHDELTRGFAKIEKAATKLCGKWSAEKSAEWIARPYWAGKLILSASLMLGSLDYAADKNILITEPYLRYYALLCCMRAVMLTDPTIEWKNGNIIEANHSKIANLACDRLAQFSKSTGSKFKTAVEEYKKHRELFSYCFPARGLQNIAYNHDPIQDCSFLAELAQAQSEIIENQASQKISGSHQCNIASVDICYRYKEDIFDSEDKHRIRQLLNDDWKPRNILLSFREGAIDDFFGAWHDDASEDHFNPDSSTRLIFSFL